MKKSAFSLVELMLVVAILGILGAIVFPTLQGHIVSARESAAKDNLGKMRAQIQLYAVQHKGTWPGYADGAPVTAAMLQLQLTATTTETGAVSPSKVRAGAYQYGPYVRAIPENPFNDLSNIAYVAEATAFADAVDGTTSGWLYKKETGEFKLNWTGQDSKGVNFYDY